jgi:DNA-binding response OmpR family regulator
MVAKIFIDVVRMGEMRPFCSGDAPYVGGGGKNHGVTSGRSRYEPAMATTRVLVADDDADIRQLLRELLERAGHEVRDAPDGRAALRALFEWRPDLVVLDVAMPELDGWATLERIRDVSDVRVLMLTARAGELEKVRGLRAGADDYMTKPFGRQELLARVEALLRREGARREETERYVDGFLDLDGAQRSVSVRGAPVALTPTEFRLLSTFVRHPNQVLSSGQLGELVWGGASRDQVKIYVGDLRRKLGEDTPIETVRGFGYRYRSP